MWNLAWLWPANGMSFSLPSYDMPSILKIGRPSLRVYYYQYLYSFYFFPFEFTWKTWFMWEFKEDVIAQQYHIWLTGFLKIRYEWSYRIFMGEDGRWLGYHQKLNWTRIVWFIAVRWGQFPVLSLTKRWVISWIIAKQRIGCFSYHP